jgi:predicted CXXCH cytochrome family protein
MKRLPFVSLSSLALTLALVAGLAYGLWTTGAFMFSPGPLTAKSRPGVTLGGFASHAEFEKECDRCHAPLAASQSELCLRCHTSVATELSTQAGVHSQVANAQDCASCHPDHRGTSFDPLQPALASYDHSRATFRTTWHQVNYDATPMDCSACHASGEKGFPFVPDSCVRCHAGHDATFATRHVADFGKNCLGCHDGADRMQHFDHAATGFPLVGRHAQSVCTACHTTDNLKDAARDCAGCHAEPPVHRGVFDANCAACHTAAAWTPATLNQKPFSHDLQSGFTLAKHAHDYANAPLTCKTCHGADFQHYDAASCVACHSQHNAAFMTQHQQDYGPACADCHDGADRMRTFDHAAVFPLQGRHAQIACEACHAQKRFKGAPSQCVQCHSDPAMHAGTLSTQCQYCHTATAWTPALLLMHNFQLDHGGHGAVGCLVCHPTTYSSYTCYGCHDHQADKIAQSHQALHIAASAVANCSQCHATGQKGEAKP